MLCVSPNPWVLFAVFSTKVFVHNNYSRGLLYMHKKLTNSKEASRIQMNQFSYSYVYNMYNKQTKEY